MSAVGAHRAVKIAQLILCCKKCQAQTNESAIRTPAAFVFFRLPHHAHKRAVERASTQRNIVAETVTHNLCVAN